MSYSVGNNVPDYYQRMRDKIDRQQEILDINDDIDDIHGDAGEVKTSTALEDLVGAYINGRVDNLDDVKTLIEAEYSIDLERGTGKARSTVLGVSNAFSGASSSDLETIDKMEQKLRLGANLLDDFGEVLMENAGIADATLIDTQDLGNGLVSKVYEDGNGTRYTLQETNSEFGYGAQLFFEDGSSTAMNIDNRRGEGYNVTLFRYDTADEDGIAVSTPRIRKPVYVEE